MSNSQLEFAWLGCIFGRPEFCRESGLCGLDQSMFKKPVLFDFGLKLLRDENYTGDHHSLSDELLQDLMTEQIFSQVAFLENEIGFLPAMYKHYAREIEKRSQAELL